LYGGKPGAVYIEKLYPIVLGDCKAQNVDVRQSALFGLGACAQAAGLSFASQIPVALGALIAAIEEQGSRDGEMESATDNAISSVGRIINGFGDLLAQINNPSYHLSQLMPLWLSWLPIMADEEEAQFVHSLLCTFVESNSPFLLGNNNANLGMILTVFGDVLGTELVDLETTNRIVVICKRVAQMLPPQSLTAIFDGLNEAQQKNLAPFLQPKE